MLFYNKDISISELIKLYQTFSLFLKGRKLHTYIQSRYRTDCSNDPKDGRVPTNLYLIKNVEDVALFLALKECHFDNIFHAAKNL